MKMLNTENIQLIQKVCLKQNIPFVSYRLPMDDEIITLVQQHSLPKKLTSLENIDHKTGFVISPFNSSEMNQTCFLEPDSTFLSAEIEDVDIQKLAKNNRFLSYKSKVDITVQTTSPAEFISNVNIALEAMNTGKFHKVVLSKIRVENLSDDFNPSTFYLNLCEKYPHAMVYFLQMPEVGCWIGATPEPLLVVENERVKTVSLAGTQLATEKNIAEYQWNQKEIEEQGIVTDYVEQTLHSLHIKDLKKVGPVNYKAANLIHLKTSFEFSKSELNAKISDCIYALHPTPSVGGLPKNKALEFVLANEKHNRAYYTGFLGPVNINNKSNIFVNLRCLQLLGKQFVLYSGAGITSSSVAEREWEETDNKMLTMMNVMKSQDDIQKNNN